MNKRVPSSYQAKLTRFSAQLVGGLDSDSAAEVVVPLSNTYLSPFAIPISSIGWRRKPR